MRGKIPAQAPYKGGEPTMRKGSYSEELDEDVVMYRKTKRTT